MDGSITRRGAVSAANQQTARGKAHANKPMTEPSQRTFLRKALVLASTEIPLVALELGRSYWAEVHKHILRETHEMDGAKYVDVNGIRTRYFEAGDGEPLLLVHGGSYGSQWNAEDWDLNFGGLAQRFRVIALDKIGMGFTSNPATDDEYLIGTTVRHVDAFIRTMDLGHVHIIGHSRGGYTATRLALQHPEIVDTLVIVDSSSLMTPPNPQYGIWKQESLRFDDRRDQYRYLITVNSYSGEHITDHYLDVVLEIDALAKTREANLKMAGVLGARFNADLVAKQQESHHWIRSGRLRCPTLVVWGYDDPSATMQRCGIPCMDLILTSVPLSETHILNRAGHISFREQPEAFNSVVADFIRRAQSGNVKGNQV